MTAEENFIRKLEVYLDTVFDKYSYNRVMVMLKEYRQEIPSVVVKEKLVEKFVPMLPTLPQQITDEQLMLLASELCLAKRISINEFIHTKQGYCKGNIVELRKEFCKKIKETYLITNKQLKLFFGVDHTTITYYINGKKYLPKKKTA